MSSDRNDRRWLDAAARLAERGRPGSCPNPAVGAIVVAGEHVVGRGWTQPGGRPHAEDMALIQAGSAAKGASCYVSLEPCVHQSERGSSCASRLIESGIARVVVGCLDPDQRTAGTGVEALRAAGMDVTVMACPQSESSLAGYLTRMRAGRPFVTLKLALSLDGCIALASGESQWITGPESRAHAHLERARSDAILIGAGTLRADKPRLDVRLPGLETRGPERWVLTRGAVPEGWGRIADPTDLSALGPAQYLLVEGGAGAAAAFLAADRVDRLLIYRAPIIVGGGRPGIADIGLDTLADAHGRWKPVDRRTLGSDAMDVYSRARRQV